MEDRLERLQDRATKRRELAKDVMIDLDLKKIAAPDFLVSIRAGTPSLLVLNEEAVPSIFWQAGEPRLKRQELLSELKAGSRDRRCRPLQPGADFEREGAVMGFSAKQVQALRRKLDGQKIRTREANGRELSYIEGWFAISEANRIFGFDGWSRETVESRCVLARENRGSFLAVYTAKVRITVNASGATVIREGHGSGEGRGTSPGEVHDIALKAAETDATKRALTTFGRPFGLELYRQARAPSHLPLHNPAPQTDQATRFGFHPDDTTPIPRPSRYYGRRHSSLKQQSVEIGRSPTPAATPAPPLAPGIPEPSPAKIDKSALTLAEPKRRRDKSHLRFVASQPCLVCGRHPSDPHHLRFAQPRALGLKVSDEFTVPLCRGHHRQLHQSGDERIWWKALNIDALPVARQLWEQTHPNEQEIETEAPNYDSSHSKTDS